MRIRKERRPAGLRSPLGPVSRLTGLIGFVVAACGVLCWIAVTSLSEDESAADQAWLAHRARIRAASPNYTLDYLKRTSGSVPPRFAGRSVVVLSHGELASLVHRRPGSVTTWLHDELPVEAETVVRPGGRFDVRVGTYGRKTVVIPRSPDSSQAATEVVTFVGEGTGSPHLLLDVLDAPSRALSFGCDAHAPRAARIKVISEEFATSGTYGVDDAGHAAVPSSAVLVGFRTDDGAEYWAPPRPRMQAEWDTVVLPHPEPGRAVSLATRILFERGIAAPGPAIALSASDSECVARIPRGASARFYAADGEGTAWIASRSHGETAARFERAVWIDSRTTGVSGVRMAGPPPLSVRGPAQLLREAAKFLPSVAGGFAIPREGDFDAVSCSGVATVVRRVAAVSNGVVDWIPRGDGRLEVRTRRAHDGFVVRSADDPHGWDAVGWVGRYRDVSLAALQPGARLVTAQLWRGEALSLPVGVFVDENRVARTHPPDEPVPNKPNWTTNVHGFLRTHRGRPLGAVPIVFQWQRGRRFHHRRAETSPSGYYRATGVPRSRWITAILFDKAESADDPRHCFALHHTSVATPRTGEARLDIELHPGQIEIVVDGGGDIDLRLDRLRPGGDGDSQTVLRRTLSDRGLVVHNLPKGEYELVMRDRHGSGESVHRIALEAPGTRIVRWSR